MMRFDHDGHDFLWRLYDVTVYLREAALEGKEMGSWNSLDHLDLQFDMMVYCGLGVCM